MKKLFAVIGNPIEHSLSPLLQNEAYQLNGIDAHFHAFHVEHECLREAVQGMKALGVQGFIVTVPFKAEIIPYLNVVDADARQMNAVNIVKKIEGKYVGYNYDGKAWLQALLEDMKQPSLSTERILLIGAGGAAQSIYSALSRFKPIDIDIANRTVSKAEQLIAMNPIKRATAIPLEEAERNQSQYDIIVQTTSIGMAPHSEQTPIQLTNVKEGAFVSDIIYNPAETKFLQQARKCGAHTQNGMKMLAFQNALAIEMWTGKKVSNKQMLDSLVKALT